MVCVGGAVLDRTLRLVADPVSGTSNPARMATGAGGVARNVAENLARMSVPVALISRVGDDDAGRLLLAGLDRLGVDRFGVRVVPGAVTAQYVALLDPAGELVIAAAAMDLFDGFAAEDLTGGPLAGPVSGSAPGPVGGSSIGPGASATGGSPVGPDAPPIGSPSAPVVFAEANLPAAILGRLVDLARRAGIRLVLDAVSTAKATRLPADLTGVAVLVANVDELRAWLAARAVATRGDAGTGDAATGDAVAGDPGDLVSRVLAAGRPAAVVGTVGADGAWVADAGGVTALPAEPATVVDVTGAGDALVAGMLAAIVAGRGLREAVAAGIALAVRTVAVPGSVVPDLAITQPPDVTAGTPGGDG